VHAENLTSEEEYDQLQESMNPSTTMMLTQLQLSPKNNNKTTAEMNMKEIGYLDYRLALF